MNREETREWLHQLILRFITSVAAGIYPPLWVWYFEDVWTGAHLTALILSTVWLELMLYANVIDRHMRAKEKEQMGVCSTAGIAA